MKDNLLVWVSHTVLYQSKPITPFYARCQRCILFLSKGFLAFFLGGNSRMVFILVRYTSFFLMQIPTSLSKGMARGSLSVRNFFVSVRFLWHLRVFHCNNLQQFFVNKLILTMYHEFFQFHQNIIRIKLVFTVQKCAICAIFMHGERFLKSWDRFTNTNTYTYWIKETILLDFINQDKFNCCLTLCFKYLFVLLRKAKCRNC